MSQLHLSPETGVSRVSKDQPFPKIAVKERTIGDLARGNSASAEKR